MSGPKSSKNRIKERVVGRTASGGLVVRVGARGSDTTNKRLATLAEAFIDLRHRDMMELAGVISESLKAINGQVVKPEVFAEVLDSLGAYIVIENEQ